MFPTIFLIAGVLLAQTKPVVSPIASSTPIATETPSSTPAPTLEPRADFTQKSEETLGPLEEILAKQNLGNPIFSPLKYGIRNAVSVGVPANTIVLLLLLPVIAAFIATARHVVGVRGFGIFLPAALAVVFLAVGPILGIAMFLLMVTTSTVMRIILKKLKVRLQYLPKMSLLLLFVVFGVLLLLFLAPVLKQSDLTNISIFPVLILVLMAEDFSKVQLGKSARTAITLATETIILSLLSYIILITKYVQSFTLLNPEIVILVVFVYDILLGKYVGLRFSEYWRYRKLLKK